MANEVRVLVKADAKQATKEIEGFKGALGKATSAFGDMLKVAGGIQLSKAMDSMVGFGKGSITAASDLNESMSKVRTVLGPASKSVEDFAATSARAFGVSKNEALAAAGTYSNLFTTMGLGQQASADMSTELVGLAADLASFNNIGTDAALEKLRSGLVGEIEPLRSLGVSFNAAQVEAKALELGLADANGEISEGAKVQARYALIMEQTSTAQGDFARTSDGMANQQRILKAQLADVQAQLGQALLPVMVAFGNVMVNQVMPAVQRFIDYAGPAIKQFMQDAKRYWESDMKPAIDNMIAAWKAIEPVVKPILEAVGSYIKMVATVLKEVVSFIVNILSGDFKGAWEDAKDIVRAVKDGIIEQFRLLGEGLRALIGNLKQVGKDLAQGLFDGITEIWTRWIAPFFQNLPGNILSFMGNALGKLYQWGKDLIQGLIDGILSMVGSIPNPLDLIPGMGGGGGAETLGRLSNPQTAGGGGGGIAPTGKAWDPAIQAWVNPWEVGSFGSSPKEWTERMHSGGITFNVSTINASSPQDAELAAGDLAYAMLAHGVTP